MVDEHPWRGDRIAGNLFGRAARERPARAHEVRGDEMAGETPTIVLVHGASADATGWEPEIRALQERGYSVIGFGNPCAISLVTPRTLPTSCGRSAGRS